MKKSTVRIYDTISKEYVDIEVSEEVYTYYNRSQWNMDDNDDSFYKHEIQFSALIGGNDGTFENFREFRIENSVEKANILANDSFLGLCLATAMPSFMKGVSPCLKST